MIRVKMILTQCYTLTSFINEGGAQDANYNYWKEPEHY